ncbi:MAG TPA: hypothetical protein P5277_03510 [Candidatus Paceibacterota bacterium]|nr:hypothetical protein [Candidatus Paceibacterota bacterium]
MENFLEWLLEEEIVEFEKKKFCGLTYDKLVSRRYPYNGYVLEPGEQVVHPNLRKASIVAMTFFGVMDLLNIY